MEDLQRRGLLDSNLTYLNAKITPFVQPYWIAETLRNCDSLITLEVLTPKIERVTLEIFARNYQALTTLRLFYSGTVTVQVMNQIVNTTGNLRVLEIDALEFENITALNRLVCSNPSLREISVLRQNLRPSHGPQNSSRMWWLVLKMRKSSGTQR